MGLQINIKAQTYAVLQRNNEIDSRLTTSTERKPRVTQHAEIKDMIKEFSTRDPRKGCWEYITKHYPALSVKTGIQSKRGRT